MIYEIVVHNQDDEKVYIQPDKILYRKESESMHNRSGVQVKTYGMICVTDGHNYHYIHTKETMTKVSELLQKAEHQRGLRG